MSWTFFEDVLDALGGKLNYDAIVNYAGNGFCSKAWEMIESSNPFTVANKKETTGVSAFANFLNSGNIKIQGVEGNG